MGWIVACGTPKAPYSGHLLAARALPAVVDVLIGVDIG